VYKLSKALYGLKQPPWAWYARFKTFLLEHGYVMESVDKTLFTLNHGTDFLLVQIYKDDIIFGCSSHTLVSIFQEMIENKFQISMMGELTFFLDIQVHEHDRLPPVPHDDTIGHSVRRVPLCVLLGYFTLFTSDDSSMNL
jgi:hypothetical protein